MSLLKAESPVPNDLGLAIPGDLPFFEVIIVIAFIVHIIFVNILVAGSVNSVLQEIKGIRTKNIIYDQLALQFATQVSIFKSIAVVMGVAPLLIISTIYTQYFYPSTILIGKMWLLMIPLTIISFLLLYAYKFSWKLLQNKKRLHVSLGIGGALILLFIPLLFITNVASMLQPELWKESRGFFQSLFLYPTIWQRYFHFMAASFAVMGMYTYWWGRRKSLKDTDPVYIEAKQFGKKSAFLFTFLQVVAGPVLLLSMNADVRKAFMGGSLFHTSLLGVSIVLAILLIVILYKLLKSETKKLFISALSILLIILLLMSWIRHEVREISLAPYIDQQPRTEQKE
ncbi:cytochrome c class I [Paenibacillus luteus]|uniref:cytochrome c class I n=1 Tax=Paenibacillus luteus TaxID=2545753 RepID=UPI0011438BBC|nr:cytochrome c class I [Paenibacillus luteus]